MTFIRFNFSYVVVSFGTLFIVRFCVFYLERPDILLQSLTSVCQLWATTDKRKLTFRNLASYI